MGMVFDTAGNLLGNEADANALDDSSLDISALDLAKRATSADANDSSDDNPDLTPALLEKRHDYALVCGNRGASVTCQNDPFSYYCNANGAVRRRGHYNELCNRYCQCVNLYPKPTRPCVFAYIVTECIVKDDVAYTEDGQLIGNVSLAHVMQNGTLDFSQAIADGDVPSVKALPSSTSSEDDSLETPEVVARDLNEDDEAQKSRTKTKTKTKSKTNNTRHLSPSTAAALAQRDHNVDKEFKATIPVVTKTSVLPVPSSSNTLHFIGPATNKRDSELSLPSVPDDSNITNEGLTSPSRFDIQCFSNGNFDQSLTNDCKSKNYTCIRIPFSPLALMHHVGVADPTCSQRCQCENYLSGNKEVDASETLSQGPPSGPLNITSPNSDSEYTLSCGNYPAGPAYCSAPGLNYLCTANMTVSSNISAAYKNSTAETWCDTYCSCIFAHPVDCINFWDIPYCQEFVDGTVRAAADPKVVLSYVQYVTLLPNKTLYIPTDQPGYFPFYAVMPWMNPGDMTSLPPGNLTASANHTRTWNGSGTRAHVLRGEKRNTPRPGEY